MYMCYFGRYGLSNVSKMLLLRKKNGGKKMKSFYRIIDLFKP